MHSWARGALLDRVLDEADLARMWRDSLQAPPSPRHRLLVACAGDQVVGLAAFGPSDDRDADPETADLETLVGHRPSVLYWVIQPGSNIGGIGAGLVRMVRPWNEWLIVWGFDIDQGVPEVTEADALQIVRNLIGDPELDAEITGISLWGNNEQYASRLQSGRVFCAGDAVHKHPPSNGLGSNTSIQDSYNLAWKLAAVLRGTAGEELLETYSSERAPVDQQIVTRANKSGREFAQLFDALGLTPDQTEEEMTAAIAARKDATPAGAERRRRVKAAMELKNYEFNAHGVELGQRYVSTAVVADDHLGGALLGVHADATVATGGNGHGDGDQFAGLGIQGALGAGFLQRAIGGEHLRVLLAQGTEGFFHGGDELGPVVQHGDILRCFRAGSGASGYQSRPVWTAPPAHASLLST